MAKPKHEPVEKAWQDYEKEYSVPEDLPGVKTAFFAGYALASGADVTEPRTEGKQK